MAMGLRGKAEVNITPMIDVVLVLLIIFMVIAPSVGLPALVPQPAQEDGPPAPPQDIVLTVLGGGKVRLNQTELNVTELQPRLTDVLKQHTAGVAFMKGPRDLEFSEMIQVIDIAKYAGWDRIALMPE